MVRLKNQQRSERRVFIRFHCAREGSRVSVIALSPQGSRFSYRAIEMCECTMCVCGERERCRAIVVLGTVVQRVSEQG